MLPHRRGCRWGVTGMLLAVPITAVLRIHLSHIYHPDDDEQPGLQSAAGTEHKKGPATPTETI